MSLPATSRRKALLLLALALALAGLAQCSSGSRSDAPPKGSTGRGASAHVSPPVSPEHSSTASARVRYHEVPFATLAHAVADPAAGAIGGTAFFAGGLDAASTSTARVGAIRGRTVHTLPGLPAALHDAAGAVVDHALYVFGGGNGIRQLDSIVRVDSHGNAITVGALPAASSDSLAATVGRTAYVVGGYTGATWLDTIVAYSPATGARVVAHLPTALRYAAVGAAAGRLVVAGGTTPSAEATSAIYVFDPATGKVAHAGDLAQPVSHASAVGVGDEVMIVGGRNAAADPQTGITLVRVHDGRVRDGGTLSAPRSDAGLVAVAGRLLLIGGRGPAGALNEVSELVPSEDPPPANVYSHDGANALSPETAHARSLVYVPNSESNTVDVIDPATYRVVDHFDVGALPQHVTPSWDLRSLYVDNDHGNSLTPLDPRTGKRKGPDIPVTDPYNLYFTSDGRDAIVVAEAWQRLDFRDPHTMALLKSVPVPCRGIDHMDFTADGVLALASCEFSGQMVVVDLHARAVRRVIDLPDHGVRPMPQDVKLSPDGSTFYVADMQANGLWVIDAHTFALEGFIPTDAGAHGLYPSRDARYLYVTNRAAGTISVMEFATRRIVATWRIPGGSPDMGGVSADGTVLWLSGRHNAAVYAISTLDGHLIATIPVGNGPHGLCVWPQPGRYSIGHTGIMR
jgi:YVTN family beta-propeller protein